MKYQTASGYAVRKFLEEYLLIPVNSPGSERVQTAIMNPVAQFLWEQMQQPRTLEELTAAVCAEFTVDASTAEADIREFLNELDNNRCLITVDVE